MKEIKLNGKTIKIEKDLLSYAMGGLLILLSFGIAGLAAYVKMGFDPSSIVTMEFWVNYVVNTVMIYTCFFGVYIVRRQINLKSSRMVVLRSALRDMKTGIVKNNKIDACRAWLEAYNYDEKLDIYTDILYNKLERINSDEPDESRFKSVNKRRARKHIKAVGREKELRAQVKNIAIHQTAVELMYKGKKSEADTMLEALPDDDMFKRTRIPWRNVGYNDLFNYTSSHTKKQTIFSNERKATFIFILPMLIFSVFVSMLMTSLTGGRFVTTAGTVMALLINLALLCWYAVRGLRMADKVVFDNIYPAEQKKQELCEQFKERDLFNGGKWNLADSPKE